MLIKIFLLFFLNILLLLLVAFFSGIETAIVSVNKIRLNFLADAGLVKAKKLLKLLENSENLISTVLCGYNVVIVILTTLSTYFFSLILPYRDLAPILTTIIFTPLILIFGEVVPKTYFRINSNKLLMRYVNLLIFFHYLFLPFQMILTFISNVFLRPFLGSLPQKNHNLISSREDLENLLEVSREEGILDGETKNMINSIFDFSEKIVREVMIPRVEIFAVSLDITKEELLDKFIQSGYSRIPVYKDRLDNILGIANVQDLVNNFSQLKDISTLVRDPFFVPETMKIDDVFRKLKKNSLQLLE
jgi:putative hemolysin